MTNTPFPAVDNPNQIPVLNIYGYSKLHLFFNAATPLNSGYGEDWIKFSTTRFIFQAI
jgi:hypothetical protein